MLKRFLKAVSGSTAIEYAIIAGMVSIVIIVGVTSVGSETNEMWDEVDNEFSEAL